MTDTPTHARLRRRLLPLAAAWLALALGTLVTLLLELSPVGVVSALLAWTGGIVTSRLRDAWPARSRA